MIQFAKSTQPPQVSALWTTVGYAVGLWTTVLAVAQMVSFEEFVRALQQYQLSGGGWTVVLAIALLALEVFSVPFLFRLPSSPAARAVSAVFALLAPYAWTAMTLAALAKGMDVTNVGYLGGFMARHLSAWMVVPAAAWALVVSAGYHKLGGLQALQFKR